MASTLDGFEIAAVASPGQTVFLTYSPDLSEAELRGIRVQLAAFVENSDVKVVVLAPGLSVARIEDV